MSIEVKSCERGGCTAAIAPDTPARFNRRRYCSNSCAAIARIWRGVPMPEVTPEQRSVGGRKGGRISGGKLHREAMRRWGAAVEVYLPQDLRESLSARQLAAVKALLVKVGKAARQGRMLPASPRERGSIAR